jgi:GTP:adenosylcobinamide-phosphate guanylyltransferase
MMDAIVIAGGVPDAEDPLYAYTQGRPKSLVDVAGKPMVQWVLDTLCGAQTIERVVVMGLTSDSGVTCDKALVFAPDQGSMLENIRAGVKQVLTINPASRQVALVSADIPAITPEIVDWVVDTCTQTDEDVYYNVVTRQVMEARFPGSNRSYVRLKDVEVCGGDLNVARTSMVNENNELWDRIIASRKNAFKQAALLGYDTLLLLLLRAISLEGAVKKVTRRLKLSGRALVSPYAELAMDVDKPHQLELLRADLAKRAPG